MVCPQCNSEYRDGFTTCGTCQVPLIPTPENYGKPTEAERRSEERSSTIAVYLVGAIVALILTGVQQWLATAYGWKSIPLLYIWFGIAIILLAVQFVVRSVRS